MNSYAGKRSAGGLMTPKKGHGVALKDAASERHQNVQFCNRIGCNGRIKYGNNTRLGVGASEKSRCSRTSCHSSNRNKIVGNYSRSNSVISSSNRSNSDSKRKLSAQLGFDSPESSLSSDSETQELRSLPIVSSSGCPLEVKNNSGKTAVTEVGSSCLSSNIRPRKIVQIKSGLHKQNAPSASSVSKSSCVGSINNGNGSRYDLRSLKRNQLPDVIPPNGISSVSKSAGKSVVKKRTPEPASKMSHSGRKITGASSVNGHAFSSTSNNSNVDSRQSSCATDEYGSGATSVRTQIRSVNMNNNKMRLSRRQNTRNSSLSRGCTVGCPDTEMPIRVGASSLMHSFSTNGFSRGSSSYSPATNNTDNHSTLTPLTSSERGFTHLSSRDALQRYTMDGIAEVLLALERIEQDEELTHEQLHALETSFLVGGFNLYDRHRDMRLDIDNMSYEELLALEERMGSVSTAVSEEELSKCLKRSIYQLTLAQVRVAGMDEAEDDVKCSICQEDYAPGDEIGKLVECEHGYHGSCINQWLRLKNWCPICKAAVATSQ